MNLEDLISAPTFGLLQDEKEKILLPLFLELHAHHKKNCLVYRKIADSAFPLAEQATCLAQLPYLPIDLFKKRRLQSVDLDDLRVSVRSSGTTGSVKSQINMDASDARLTARALVSIFRETTSGTRLPMLIVDTPSILKSTDHALGDETLGARAAAILGLMPLGRDHLFLLNQNGEIQDTAFLDFMGRNQGQEILIYGFTSLVWHYFLPLCERLSPDLSKGVLLHSGGWKKLLHQAVDQDSFFKKLHAASQIKMIRNFYGMAEMPGTVFLENDAGHLVPPCFADVIIRDPVTFDSVPDGEQGLVQVLHILPHSFPGHSMLTEDIGRIVSRDQGGCGGKGLQLLGRVKKADPRGCSDVHS